MAAVTISPKVTAIAHHADPTYTLIGTSPLRANDWVIPAPADPVIAAPAVLRTPTLRLRSSPDSEWSC